ncbi:MAG: fibronectin type III domain-containing protein, partial [Ruminococcus sp.]|nr:fibronectin type III domain-containing protein [Ruminococcus sp.]
MKGSKIALIVLLGFIIAISGVTVVGFALSDSDDSKAKKADETAMSASITTNRPRSVMLSGVNGITVDKLEPHKVVLSWSALNGATGYNVFALDTDVDTEYKLIANTNKPTAELNNLADTTKYRFRITAYIQKNGTLYECPATEYELFTPIGEAEDIKIESSSEVLAFSWKQNDK